MSDEAAADASRSATAEHGSARFPVRAWRDRGSRHRILATVVLVATLAILAGVAVWQVPDVSALAPANGGYVSDRSPTIRLAVSGLGGLKDVRVRIDGRDVSSKVRVSRGEISLFAGALSDGVHRATLEARSNNPFRRHLRRSWRFTVDTSTPELDLTTLKAKPVVTTSPAVFAGVTEPAATVTVKAGAVSGSAVADANGRYHVTADLPEGTNDTTFTVEDRAGNLSRQRIDILVDQAAPRLSVGHVSSTLHATRATFSVAATDAASTPRVAASLNGRAVAVTGTAKDGVVKLSGLAQGTMRLKVTATDEAGHVTTVKRSFLVDSTETYGRATLLPGARGEDVAKLQKRLTALDVYDGSATGVFDAATETAVRRLQARYGLACDGIAGPRVLVLLSGQRIVVDLSQCRLYLYRDDDLIRSYRVATGRSAYPTPTGTFTIVEKVKDPTWSPPDSEWAEGATLVEAGEDNPLGTRWMGLSTSGIGIHGVPASENDSIGTHASHGCIRMLNVDAIDLFSRVSVGMPVVIRS